MVSHALGQESVAEQETSALAPGKWVIICLALYLVRVLPWMLGELWHDEVITLGDFVLGPADRGVGHVFRSYPVANNHMLFSLVGWWWVRFLGFTLDEYLLRLPCMAFGAATIVLALLAWRRWLGAPLACLAGVTLAISPVFGAFACEFRGYSLTMLLSAVAVTGLAELSAGHLRRGLWLQVPVFVALPLVIPSNVFLALAHALFLLLWPGWPRSGRARLLASAAVGLAGLAGLSYYATIWEQFAKVMRETSGWTSGAAVLGAVGLGFWAHLGAVGVLLPALLLRRRRGPVAGGGQRAWGLLYAGCLAVPILGTALGNYTNAPFPRVYLVYLLPLTFAACRCLRPTGVGTVRAVLLWAGLTVILGFTWERVCRWRTEVAVAAGGHPQNLLQQYYRDRTDLRGLAGALSQAEPPRGALLLTDAYDFPTFRFYWAQNGLPPEAVFAVNRLPPEFWPRARRLPGATLHAVAGSEMEAARLFAAAGAPGAFLPGMGVGLRRVYTWIGPTSP